MAKERYHSTLWELIILVHRVHGWSRLTLLCISLVRYVLGNPKICTLHQAIPQSLHLLIILTHVPLMLGFQWSCPWCIVKIFLAKENVIQYMPGNQQTSYWFNFWCAQQFCVSYYVTYISQALVIPLKLFFLTGNMISIVNVSTKLTVD